MENLSMCRICLATDVRLCSIASHLRDMYERITAMTFKREDRRPLVACYICHARLQNCYRLRTSCLRSEELYTVMMSSGVLVAQQHSSTNTFRTSSLLHFSLGHVLQNSTECHVKEEASEIIHDAELYQYNTEKIVREGQEGQCTVVDDNSQCSHLEDSLGIIKRELDDVQTEIVTEAQEEQCSVVDDNFQCSHLEDPLDVIKRETDDVETGVEDINLNIEDTILEESDNPNDVGLPSQLADNTCPKMVKVVLQRIDVNDTERDIMREAQEEQCTVIDDNIQGSHLKDPLNVIKREPDDVETGVEDIELNIEDTILEESDNCNDVGLSSQLAVNICPKIVKVVLQRIDVYDTGRGARDSKKNKIVAKKDTEDATTHKIKIKVKTVFKKTEVKKRVSTRKIFETCDKLDIKLNKCENVVTSKVNNVCEESTNSRSLKHDVRSISIYRQFLCDTCKNRFIRKNLLKNHVLRNSGNKPNQCHVCKKYFPKKGDSSNHEPYQCEACNKCFIQKGDLKRHYRTHTGEKLYQCDDCNERFSLERDLKTHIRKHTGDKPYQCDVCKKRFNRESHLNTHMRIHTGVKPYQCEVCKKCFNQESHLRTHIRIHTGVKPYQCDICNVRFNQVSNLKTHIRIHTGEKPYQCEVCKKYFNQESNLRTHIRIHTGVKPYQCDICKVRFNQESNLKIHYRSHTGKRPYQCDLCRKCFIRKGDLNCHYRTHTGEKPH